MGIRGVQGGVRYDRGVVMAPPHGIFTKKIFVPHTMISGFGVVQVEGWEGRGKGLFYLSWRAEVSYSVWFQMWGTWYLPKFLFKEESFTQMYMASFMFLVNPCVSLCTKVKQSGLNGCHVELLSWWKGDGALRCSLSLSPNVLPDSPIYSQCSLCVGI